MSETEIVARHGEAQRIVLLKVGHGRRRAIDFSGTAAAAMRLPTAKRPALTDRDITRENGRRTAWYRLTDSGLAVRALLSAEVARQSGRDGE